MDESTCTLIIITDGKVTVRENIPIHPGMEKSLPWVFVDENNVVHYPVWKYQNYNIYCVCNPNEKHTTQETSNPCRE